MSAAPAAAELLDDTDHRAQIRAINAAIRAEDDRLRAAHPWLAHQETIGALLFGACLAAMAAVTALYLRGSITPWLAVPLMALPLSILHELEHDLIHGIYFRRSPRVQDAMFLLIWLSKLSLDPWTRRLMHLRHHRRSGQIDDVEERLIGLGVPFGLRRILIAVHGSALVYAPFLFAELRRARRKERASDERPAPGSRGPRRTGPREAPSALLIAANAVVLVAIPAAIVWGIVAGQAWAMAVLVLVIAPNLLRHFCIALMSSYSHYYGDIAPNDVFVQNQILSHWALWPFQLFCFNFGSTHIIHHYVVDQPFYLRQMVAPAAHREMVRLGVRRNDSGVVRRANRWAPQP
jgi:fatty acid desaturase